MFSFLHQKRQDMTRTVQRPLMRRLSVTAGPFAVLFLLITAAGAGAQNAPADAKPSMEIYGFAMMDIGHNFNTIHPDWFDTMRVTKLPSFEGEFGEDHNAFAGVRQSRLGAVSYTHL